jgi:hypothetical protein
MIIGDIPAERTSKILTGPEELPGRTISPSVYIHAEFKKRLSKADPFISRLMKELKIFLKEKDNRLQKAAQ